MRREQCRLGHSHHPRPNPPNRIDRLLRLNMEEIQVYRRQADRGFGGEEPIGALPAKSVRRIITKPFLCTEENRQAHLANRSSGSSNTVVVSNSYRLLPVNHGNVRSG